MLIFALLFLLFSPAIVSAEPLAQINISIGIVEVSENSSITVSDDKTKKNITALLTEAQKIINELAFGGENIIKLQIGSFEKLKLANPPKVELKSEKGYIVTGWDYLQSASIVDANAYSKKTDLQIFIFSNKIIDISNGEIFYTGGFYIEGTNKIAISYINQEIYAAQYPRFYPMILLHELGHYLGLKHKPKKECEKIRFIMCEDSRVISTPQTTEASYKKAWHDFYYLRTGQKPPQ
ncbi:MAG: hypothetical protein Q7R75_01020 [bacterium]|nr:hypothetical protein [bacterium]